MSVQPTTGLPRCDATRMGRSQRTYRITVVLAVFLTMALKISGIFLHENQSELQYSMALSLRKKPALHMLRAAVQNDKEKSGTVNPIYLEALAEVEPPRNMLSLYEEARQLNPKSESLLIKYGCELYAQEQYEEARERFREAGINPPRNTLPRYLESAALATAQMEQESLRNALALLARANSSSDPLLVVEPLWSENVSRRAKGYLERQYELTDRIFGTIHNSASRFCAYVDEETVQENAAQMDEYLEKLEAMSVRLLGVQSGDSRPAIPQLDHALQIQLEVVQLRKQFSEQFQLPAQEGREARITELKALLADLERFQEAGKSLAKKYNNRNMSSTFLVMGIWLYFWCFWAVMWSLHTMGKDRKKELPMLPIPSKAKALLFAAFSLLFLLLMVLPALYTTNRDFFWEPREEQLTPVISILFILVFGLYFPFTSLRSYIREAKQQGITAPWVTGKLKQFQIFTCLSRRYNGLLLGNLIICACVAYIAHHIVYGVGPFQSYLLPSGLAMDINSVIDSIISRVTHF